MNQTGTTHYRIYREVYQRDLDWVVDDQSRLTPAMPICWADSSGFDVVPEMVMKLIELEVSNGRIKSPSGDFDKLGTILKQDWGSLEEIQQQQAALQNVTTGIFTRRNHRAGS